MPVRNDNANMISRCGNISPSMPRQVRSFRCPRVLRASYAASPSAAGSISGAEARYVRRLLRAARFGWMRPDLMGYGNFLLISVSVGLGVTLASGGSYGWGLMTTAAAWAWGLGTQCFGALARLQAQLGREIFLNDLLPTLKNLCRLTQICDRCARARNRWINQADADGGEGSDPAIVRKLSEFLDLALPFLQEARQALTCIPFDPQNADYFILPEIKTKARQLVLRFQTELKSLL